MGKRSKVSTRRFSTRRFSPRRSGTLGRTRAAVIGTGTIAVCAAAAGFAGPAFAAAIHETPAAQAAHTQPLVPGTPCTVTSKACVDLESQKAWLFKDGKIMRGPVKIASGGKGQETPIGHSLRVYRKEADYKSTESRLPNGQPGPMPWSVFFEDGGIAFHGGNPQHASAGCIHLAVADAKAWFDYLQVGDQVQVVRGSQELAARKADKVSISPASDHETPSSDDSDSDDESDS